jgi:hypothetical protein
MQISFSTRFHAVLAMSALCAGGGLVAGAGAQSFTPADSGWVRIFNGTDFTGLYSRTYNVAGANAPLVRPPAAPYAIVNAGTDTAAIRVTSAATATQGNIGTDDTTYSHYRMRVEAKYDTYGTTNAGLTYHTRENAIRMNNNWPRSIEFQFKQNETGHAFSIQQVTFNIRANGATWTRTGGTMQTGCEFGCSRRSFSSSPVISTSANPPTNTQTRWLRYLLVVRGADSATHIVQDTVVLTLSNIRIFNDSTKNTGSSSSNSSSASNKTPNGPHGSGGFTLQSEGGLLNYRRWEVMRFPPTTPKDEPFLHRLFLDTPVGAVKPAGGAQVALAWRSIGTLPKVKIEYRVGSGAWQTAADSVPNTGSYNWTAPGSVPDSLRFRISSADYVWADSTEGTGPVSIRYGMKQTANELFTVRGGEFHLAGVAEFGRMEILDPSGRLVRTVAVSGPDVRWNLTTATGAKVRPGLYFFRLTGSKNSGAAVHGRVMIL